MAAVVVVGGGGMKATAAISPASLQNFWPERTPSHPYLEHICIPQVPRLFRGYSGGNQHVSDERKYKSNRLKNGDYNLNRSVGSMFNCKMHFATESRPHLQQR